MHSLFLLKTNNRENHQWLVASRRTSIKRASLLVLETMASCSRRILWFLKVATTYSRCATLKLLRIGRATSSRWLITTFSRLGHRIAIIYPLWTKEREINSLTLKPRRTLSYLLSASNSMTNMDRRSFQAVCCSLQMLAINLINSMLPIHTSLHRQTTTMPFINNSTKLREPPKDRHQQAEILRVVASWVDRSNSPKRLALGLHLRH